MTTYNNTLDVIAAGKMMNIHPQTVLDLISAGALPAAKVGRAYVLLTRDVMNYVERAIIKQTAERMRRPLLTRGVMRPYSHAGLNNA